MIMRCLSRDGFLARTRVRTSAGGSDHMHGLPSARAGRVTSGSAPFDIGTRTYR